MTNIQSNLIQANLDEDIASSMEKMAALIEQTDEIDSNAFQIIVDYSTRVYGIEPTLVADRFSVNKGTVSRWASGKSLPHVMARPTIINWIREVLLERASNIRNNIAVETAMVG